LSSNQSTTSLWRSIPESLVKNNSLFTKSQIKKKRFIAMKIRLKLWSCMIGTQILYPRKLFFKKVNFHPLFMPKAKIFIDFKGFSIWDWYMVLDCREFGI
jgi:hypothetical protein